MEAVRGHDVHCPDFTNSLRARQWTRGWPRSCLAVRSWTRQCRSSRCSTCRSWALTWSAAAATSSRSAPRSMVALSRATSWPRSRWMLPRADRTPGVACSTSAVVDATVRASTISLPAGLDPARLRWLTPRSGRWPTSHRSPSRSSSSPTAPSAHGHQDWRGSQPSPERSSRGGRTRNRPLHQTIRPARGHEQESHQCREHPVDRKRGAAHR